MSNKYIMDNAVVFQTIVLPMTYVIADVLFYKTHHLLLLGYQSKKHLNYKTVPVCGTGAEATLKKELPLK